MQAYRQLQRGINAIDHPILMRAKALNNMLSVHAGLYMAASHTSMHRAGTLLPAKPKASSTHQLWRLLPDIVSEIRDDARLLTGQ